MPFATSLALTETARDIETNVNKRIGRVFDRPTPFTKRAVFVQRASKAKLVATVGIKDKQAEYLELQEEGGTRLPKGRALVMPVQARVNQYGNIPRKAVARAVARPDTFAGKVKGVGGIWQRAKAGRKRQRSIKLLYAFEAAAQYRPRFGFMDTARKTAEARFPSQFWRALARAVSTAK
ncbi:MAG: hypothetical protein AcusKO_29470 [Acuticoccus sp.]